MVEHALLSASSAHRWLECPPSAKACAGRGDTASEYARQGTDCHALCAYLVEKALGRNTRDPTEDLTYYDTEMQDCASGYCAYVMEQIEEAKKHSPDPLIMVEQRLDFSRWVESGFGTGDCVIVSDDVLQIIDYKHGVGVLVWAEKNPQLMLYALGALELCGSLYDIHEVRMTIYQPRRENISTFVMSTDDLYRWAEEVLRPAAKLAYEGGGEYKAGEHCRFCRIRAVCRKRAEYNLKLAQYDFQMPETLDETEIAAILPEIESLISWAGDVKEYALKKAVSGTKFPGFKVVEGRSSRKYVDDAAAAAAVAAAGYDPYEKKLLGITAMTSMLGKKKFDEILGGLICKPPGKPALVPESDKRPAMSRAKEDFKDI